jgi:hypothetical protein
MNDTTRRYPRSMQEAFKDADYAASIEGYSTKQRMTFLDFAVIALSLSVCFCVLAYVLL